MPEHRHNGLTDNRGEHMGGVVIAVGTGKHQDAELHGS